MTARLSRREILAGVAITGVAVAGGALAGRKGGTPAADSPTPLPSGTTATGSPSPSPSAAQTTTDPPSDHPAVRAYDAEAGLVATYTAIAGSLDGTTAARLDGPLGDHHRHLDALAAVASAAVPGWSPSGVQLPAPQSTLPLVDVAALERAASAAMLGLVPSASGDLAGLLASIAASEASHAQIVGVLRHVSAP
ncbi:MAG: hypothetical protein QOH99_871 [Frankiaceae bacterium]|nr:hypothetical protein [Frankiaceae bacterium]